MIRKSLIKYKIKRVINPNMTEWRGPKEEDVGLLVTAKD
jgi:hypothetical protein